MRKLAGPVTVALGLVAPALLALGLVAGPKAWAGNPCFHGFESPSRNEASETEIKLLPCAFAPTVAQVPPGATVTFVSGPEFTHLVTGANGEWGSRDVEIQPGDKVSYTFEEPGVYPYACALHPGMSGAIVVGDAEAESAAVPPGGAATGEDSAASQPSAVAGAEFSRPLVGGIAAGVLVALVGVWLVRRRAAAVR